MANASEALTSGPAKKDRLVSLDVLRGITIAFMIIVNNGMGVHAYAPLQHSVWNGWTPTDLVFPTFLFIVGLTTVFSLEARLSRGDSRSSLMLHVLRRAVILFLLGLVVNGFPYFPLTTLRIYGVLQRIAICFLFASLVYLLSRNARGKAALIGALIGILLLGYWIVMRFVPVPGFGAPVRDFPLLDPNRNLAAYLDRHIFPGRLYEKVRDPEGFLSTFPALATTLLGTETALWLRSRGPKSSKALGMMLYGVLGLIIGSLWGHWFPINKKLWTSSYVMFAAGWSLIALSICYWAVEIRNWRKGWTHIWLVFGKNAITAYVFSELLASALFAVFVHAGGGSVRLKLLLVSISSRGFASPQVASLVYSLSFLLVCYLPVAWLYRKRIFLRV